MGPHDQLSAREAAWGRDLFVGVVVALAVGVLDLSDRLRSDDGSAWETWPRGEQELVERLPTAIRDDCRPAVRTVQLAGQTGAVRCRVPGTNARFVRYDAFLAAPQARAHFDYHQELASRQATGGSCVDNSAEVGVWGPVGGPVSGRFACYLYGEGKTPVLIVEVKTRAMNVFVADRDASLSLLWRTWSDERRDLVPVR